jgi:hypothetical protein
VNVAWEYRENELVEGALYANSGELKDAVKRWSTLTSNREFRVEEFSTSV